MPEKSVKLRILMWFEVIIAARIILFAVPVLLNKYLSGSPLMGYEEKFINILSLAALFYFVAGLSALLGNKFWKVLHYVVAVIICALSFPFLGAVGMVPNVNYFLMPAVFSILLCLGLLSSRGKTV